MTTTRYKISLLLFCILLPLASCGSNYVTYDDYLQKKANVSYQKSLEAYDPHPDDATDEFNILVGE